MMLLFTVVDTLAREPVFVARTREKADHYLFEARHSAVEQANREICMYNDLSNLDFSEYTDVVLVATGYRAYDCTVYEVEMDGASDTIELVDEDEEPIVLSKSCIFRKLEQCEEDERKKALAR